jgi:NAD(P)H-flavin reductase
MSQYLDSLDIGDTLEVRGPVGEFEYSADGNFTIEGHSCHATHFNMVAGGTGITPVMQVAEEILRNPSDLTKMSLIFARREENDLLLRSTLDEYGPWPSPPNFKYTTFYPIHGVQIGNTRPDLWINNSLRNTYTLHLMNVTISCVDHQL